MNSLSMMLRTPHQPSETLGMYPASFDQKTILLGDYNGYHRWKNHSGKYLGKSRASMLGLSPATSVA